MSTMAPAIVLGIDTPIGLSVVRELGEHGVPVHGVARSPTAIGIKSRWLQSWTPRPQAFFGEWLPELIRSTGAGAVYAISEPDLIALSRLDPIIEGARILTPRAQPLGMVLDKQRTLERARSLGIDVPESWQPEDGDDFSKRAAELCYPVVAKWRDPMSVMGLLEARGQPFVKSEYAMNPAALIALLNRYRSFGQWPLVQSYCPGYGFGQMIYMEKGQSTLRFQHRRLHEWPPEGGVSTLCTAEPLDRHQTQMKLSEALLRSIGWEGPAMVEYRHDPATGRYWLMEINGRFWGSLPLARACHAYFAWEAYRREVLGERGEAARPRAGIRARYMVPETRRLARILFSQHLIADPVFRSRPWEATASYVAGFLDPRMRYFIFSLSDPGPFIADTWACATKVLSLGTHWPDWRRRARSA